MNDCDSVGAVLILLIDLWYGDIISTVNQYAGFVDANALSFLWPKEFDNFVICFISGPLNGPILSCFAPYGKQIDDPALTEVFIRCDGQHFTLLRPVMIQGGFKVVDCLFCLWASS